MAMDGTETDSMCHVKASDLYPKRELLCDECELVVPFTPVCGEAVEYLGRDVDVVIALSNYRFYLQLKDTYYNIPLGLIDLLEVKDIFFLHIFCKDARSLRNLNILGAKRARDLGQELFYCVNPPRWRSWSNAPVVLSQTTEDGEIEVQISLFDMFGPRHTGNGAVIARCSQPEVGWLGWRSSEDEDLLKAIADACAFDQGHLQSENGESILDLTNSILAKEDIFVDLDRKNNSFIFTKDGSTATFKLTEVLHVF
uniref:Myotubularin phosphatase domain-containing protein n=1 Tax=Timema bartmani TaxID=61472 RepID=A0A7R9EZC0_9NEOP|nr:unnamed protein product [Timema bartmani]